MSVQFRIKQVAKRIAMDSGALWAFHRLSRRDTLTVAMFHRVMPEDDPRFAASDAEFTMRLDTFKRCLDYFATFYQPVSLAELTAAVKGDKTLPPNALLITFDDGWEDTFRYAAPALRERDMPSVVFITTGAPGSDVVPWKDVAACVWRAMKATAPERLKGELASITSLVAWLEAKDAAARDAWLTQEAERLRERVKPLMMSWDDARNLARSGAAVGGHGVTHTPLTVAPSVEAEIKPCFTTLAKELGAPPNAFAFPHGCFTPEIAERVRAAGFDLLFTSEPHINRVQHGRPTSKQFGRLVISEANVVDADGRFAPELLALLTISRPVAPAR